MERGACFGSSEKGNNHCAALQKNLTLAPGETVRLVWMLGEGGLEEARRVREKYSDGPWPTPDRGIYDSGKHPGRNHAEISCRGLSSSCWAPPLI